MDRDNEANRLSARASRYARLGVNAGALAARVGVNRLRGGGRETDAKALASALGSMKGPLMKVAQMLTTIPDALPADYRRRTDAAPVAGAADGRGLRAPPHAGRTRAGLARALRRVRLQARRRRLARPGASRDEASTARRLACKLQYPDMASAVETDLSQLDLLFSLHRRDRARRSTPARSRARSASGCARSSTTSARRRSPGSIAVMLADRPFVRVPRVDESLSTRRLLTLQWLDGEPLSRFESAPQEARDAIAVGLFDAWWRPFLRYGVIHGDPHLGNYAVAASGEGAKRASRASTCSTTAACASSRRASCCGVVELYRALKANDEARIAEAYAMWGFPKLTPGTFEAMTIWARFMCGPILDDRVRTAADGVKPSEYGRREIGQVHAGVEGRGRGPAGAARIRVSRAGDDRPRRRVPAARRAAQLSSHLRGRDRRTSTSGGRAPAGRGAGGGRTRPSRAVPAERRRGVRPA